MEKIMIKILKKRKELLKKGKELIETKYANKKEFTCTEIENITKCSTSVLNEQGRQNIRIGYTSNRYSNRYYITAYKIDTRICKHSDGIIEENRYFFKREDVLTLIDNAYENIAHQLENQKIYLEQDLKVIEEKLQMIKDSE